jgi:uncharacterized protein YcbK (DUF882 family)
MTDFAPYMNFTHEEMQCICGCGQANMAPQTMRKLQVLRNRIGPIFINSAYRCEAHNKAVGGSINSAHLKGRAVDVRCAHGTAYDVALVAMNIGFTGIGPKQHGEGRFIHLDDIEKNEFPDISRPRIFTYSGEIK